MGQTSTPLSRTSQQLNQQTSLVATGTNDTFTFQAPPTGLTWTGTLVCTSAPVDATFVAYVNGTEWASWGGNSIAGPVQTNANQQLTVVCQNLLAGTSYLMVWNGSSDPANVAPSIWPEPNSSSLVAQTIGVAPGVIYQNNAFTLPFGGFTNLNIPPTTRTLVFTFTAIPGTATLTNLAVEGAGNYSYYYGPPYLDSNTGLGPADNYVVVVPIIAADNPQFEILGTGTWTITVYADPQQYDESVFYNGTVQANSSTTSGATLVSGPARLLTAAVNQSNATAAFATLNIGGKAFLQCYGAGNNSSLSFPPNTILPAGTSLTLTHGGGGAGFVTWAFP